MNMPYYGGTLALKQEADLVLSCFHFFDALRHIACTRLPHLGCPVSCDSFNSTTGQFWATYCAMVSLYRRSTDV